VHNSRTNLGSGVGRRSV